MQQQPQGRLPQVTPAVFEAINQLDGFIQKAPLTRAEHNVAFQHLQGVLRHVETLEAQVASLTKPQADTEGGAPVVPMPPPEPPSPVAN